MPTCILGAVRQRSFINCDPARKLTDMGNIPCLVSLHESTSPESIAEDQRQAVKEAVARLGRHDILALSEAVFLHPWIVRRRLAELEGRAPPGLEGKKIRPNRFLDVVAVLRKEGPMTVRQISVAVGVHLQTIHWYLNHHTHLFRVHHTVGVTKFKGAKPVNVWGLAEQQPAKGKVIT